jgi:cobaltochelatase CobN
MRITAIFWQSHVGMLAQGAAELPGLELDLYATRSLESDPQLLERALAGMETSEAILLYRSGESVWAEIEAAVRELEGRVPVICLSHDPSFWVESSLPLPVVRRCYEYVVYGGRENFANLLRYAAAVALGSETDAIPGPQPQPWEGYWHPEAEQPFYRDYEGFAAWSAEYRRSKGLERAPLVGLLFSRHYWVNDNAGPEAALIRALEAEGLAALPVFSYGAKDENIGNKGSLAAVREAFFDARGVSRIDALVKLSTFFLGQERDSPNDGTPAKAGVELFTRLNVPVFQPVVSTTRTLEAWAEDMHGLGNEIAWMVAMPEFEGVIEPFFLGGVQREGATRSGADLETRVAEPERCVRLARRVKRWVLMRNTPVQERKVAFILHNNPCASVEASVGGAAKLDSLESVARILASMREAGYRVDVPADGGELIRTIMERKAISEFRWTTVDEIVSKGGALELLPLEIYREWWDAFPSEVQERVVESWGNPPGEHLHGVPPSMVYEGKIIISGVSFGNAVVLVQPKRGCAGPRCDGQVCKILHDPEIPPPHQYLATYRWIEQRFGAHALVHVGTHGNLEFLPGKSIGLSQRCLPDVGVHEIPHLYIYNSDNPPEGTVAKRRSYAVLVDHMQTSMARAGLYEGLEELDQLLDQYEQAKKTDKARAHALEHLIMGALRATNMDKELGIDIEAPEAQDHEQDFDALTTRIHEILSRHRSTYYADGMHVFGSMPEGGRRADVIYSILRHDGGDEKTLRKTLCRLMGLELAELLAAPGAINARYGQSNGRLKEELDRIGRALTLKLVEAPEAMGNGAFQAAVVELLGERLIAPEFLPQLDAQRDRALDIHRRIEASDEIGALLNAFSGGHVPAGPSGVLTRGREDILPTGRNFYSLDPRRAPTKAACMVGRNLAEALLAKHLREEGRYPESVAMFWMANDIMWADGEAMGQMLHLLGARPRWTSDGRVSGVELVSLEELGRPRIDLTVRASGLIRDNFPDRLELLDDALAAVSALDEPEDMNFPRKHTLERLRQAKASVEDPEALRRASLRIFTSRPGTYQAGVNLAIYASAWKTEEDLSDIFLHWNGYAYGRGVYGEQATAELASALSHVEVTYNKVVSDEHDLLGCCAYFGTHGGMTAAARHLSGKPVRSYYGDTREPERVEVRDLADEVRRVVRSKLLHPGWIEGMKRHGYKGAGDISKRVGRVYGWEASTGEVDDWVFDDIAKTFVLDEENRAFFEEHNPWALEEINRRLLEAYNRGLWKADPEIAESLKEHALEIEGWLEERMGDAAGEFQGGAVDIIGASDVDRWREALNEMKSHLNKG